MAEKIVDGIPVLMEMKGTPAYQRRTRPLPRKIIDKSVRRLNKKQKNALKELMKMGKEGKNITSPVVKKEAAIRAGYSESYASTAMTKLLGRKPIAVALEKKGVTDEMIAEVIKEGMTEPRNPKNPELKDYHAIHKFVQEANKLKDNYPAQKIQSEQKVIHIHLTAEDFKALQKYEKLREGNGKEG